MAKKNWTNVAEFILVGFVEQTEMEIPFFILFLVIYLITLVGNLGMIVLIRIDSQLHTPMYFFLSHLSLVDACYSSVITPKMLMDFLTKHKAICFMECAIQFCFYGGLAGTECLLLAVMAYDRYVAICNPLLYPIAMSRRKCAVLVTISYGTAFFNSVVQTISTFQLPFCGSTAINNFFCDIVPLLKLSCVSTRANEILILASTCIIGMSSCFTILLSYFYILSAILKIHSLEGKRKAFSTCTSHLTAIIIFYGTLLFIYFRPRASHLQDKDKVISVFYTVVIPMMNPLIYSLRNKEVKDALRKAGQKSASLLRWGCFCDSSAQREKHPQRYID
ncbi:olfactory receptor 1009-like [Varanus komodoensis]|uniref:olfactory receptor 1009-like n=1 Tax=Varanus komodoensis TaxID=61221 RepID=UPI001CF7B832|nr:olfactory receptor 1009-like [Varanus komodoensis]